MVPKSKRQYVRNYAPGLLAAKLKGAKGAPFPKFIEPSLATLADKPPSGERWVHEIKFDGYRLQIHLKQGEAKFYTRRGYDWTPRFKVLVEPLWHLSTYGCILDGEVIVPDDDGVSDFGALESALAKGGANDLVFYAFDLLYIDGFDIRKCSLLDRKAVLAELMKNAKPPLMYSEHLEVDGKDMYRDACKLKLEGVVSKTVTGTYQSGRSNNWSKTTCRKRETFVVAGIAYKGNKFDGIYLGRQEDGSISYAGKVEHGFSVELQRDLEKKAKPLLTPRQVLKPAVKKPKAKWLKPKLLAEVEYRALTGEGKLRHPSFKGLREDL